MLPTCCDVLRRVVHIVKGSSFAWRWHVLADSSHQMKPSHEPRNITTTVRIRNKDMMLCDEGRAEGLKVIESSRDPELSETSVVAVTSLKSAPTHRRLASFTTKGLDKFHSFINTTSLSSVFAYHPPTRCCLKNHPANAATVNTRRHHPAICTRHHKHSAFYDNLTTTTQPHPLNPPHHRHYD
jgi:hypothetical protein